MRRLPSRRAAGIVAALAVLAALGYFVVDRWPDDASGELVTDDPSLPPPIRTEQPDPADPGTAGDCAIDELSGGPGSGGSQVSVDGDYVFGWAPSDSGLDDLVIWHGGVMQREVTWSSERRDYGGLLVGGEDGDLAIVGERALNQPEAIAEAGFDGAEPQSYLVRAVEVNERGDILGRAGYDGDFAFPDPQIAPDVAHPWLAPLVWPAGSADPVLLDLDDGMTGSILGLTDDGRVLGAQGPPDDKEGSGWVPRVWNMDGTGETLPRIELSNGELVMPIDVAGDWVLSAGEVDGRGARWRLSDPSDVEELDADLTAKAIDADGRVYGDVAGVPARLDGTGLDTLPMLDDEAETPYGSIADVSSDGTLATGISTREDDPRESDEHAVTWSCDE